MIRRATDWPLFLGMIGLLLPSLPTARAAEAVPLTESAAAACDFQRAGNPECIAPHARPSNGPGDTGYYVGGGAAFRGEPRTAAEGTWGWDFQGLLCLRRIDLGWFHGARYQGGAGQYTPDRQKLLNH